LGTHSADSSVKEEICFASSCAIASDFCEFSIGVEIFSRFQEVVVDSLEGESVVLGVTSTEFGDVFITDIECEAVCPIASQFLLGKSDFPFLFSELDELFIGFETSVQQGRKI
jgi:hypothetical protein